VVIFRDSAYWGTVEPRRASAAKQIRHPFGEVEESQNLQLQKQEKPKAPKDASESWLVGG
jgi:hypothetical protein